MELNRVESVWDYVYDLNLDMPSLQKGLERVIVKPNRFNPTIIQSAFYGLGIDEVPIKMKDLQRMCRGRCKSLKMFFQAENRYVIPLERLKELNFEPSKEKNIWVYDHPDYSVSAIAIPSFTEAEWVLQIDKRQGNGIPMAAWDYARVFNLQLKLPLGMEEVAV